MFYRSREIFFEGSKKKENMLSIGMMGARGLRMASLAQGQVWRGGERKGGEGWKENWGKKRGWEKREGREERFPF